MRHRGYVAALLLYTFSSLVAAAIALDDSDKDPSTLIGGMVVGVLVAIVLWFFQSIGHRWPKWVLLVLILFGAGSLVSFLDARSALALMDVSALVVLLRGWPRGVPVEADRLLQDD